jgi:hypothetical protein
MPLLFYRYVQNAKVRLILGVRGMEKNNEQQCAIDLMFCKNCKSFKAEQESGLDITKGFCLERNVACLENDTCASFDDNMEEKLKEFRLVYDDIIAVLDKYMDMNEENKRIVAVWIIGTWLHSNFPSFPYLFINATKGSGKTRLLKIIKSFSKGGNILNSITEAVLFRTTGMLGIDEFEGIGRKGNESLRELLNSAYKSGSKVMRMQKRRIKGKEEQFVEEFDIYRPIALANIWGMEEVLGDRCVPIVLDKSSDTHKINLIEIWETDEHYQKTITTLNSLVKCSLCRCSSLFNIYKGWNDYLLFSSNNYTTIHIYNNNNKYINNINNNEFYKKIEEIKIDGRSLELGLPIFLIANFIGEDVFEAILKDFKEITNQKKDEALMESLDASLLDFLSQEVETREFQYVGELTKKFKSFQGGNDDWLNEKWFGRALKRLNLVVEKKRYSQGILVRLNFPKIHDKIRMFKVEEKTE